MDLQQIIMGLLMKGSAHGYELKKMLEKELSPFFQVSASSLYYTLKKLEKEKLVSSRSIVSGNRPKRYVYSLTTTGKNRIKKILLKNISELHRPFLNLDISLYFLNFLNPKDVLQTLKERKKELRKITFLLERQKKKLSKESAGSTLQIITTHNLRFVRAEMDFVEDLLTLYANGNLHKTNLFREVKQKNDRQ